MPARPVHRRPHLRLDRSILKTGLDRAFNEDAVPEAAPLLHVNIRGRGYYH